MSKDKEERIRRLRLDLPPGSCLYTIRWPLARHVRHYRCYVATYRASQERIELSDVTAYVGSVIGYRVIEKDGHFAIVVRGYNFSGAGAIAEALSVTLHGVGNAVSYQEL